MQAQETRYYTSDEYLALEETAEYKHEYHDGLIVPMTGGTTNHNRIAGNIYAALHTALKRQPYEAFIGDVRLWIPRKRRYVYPDVMVIAGAPDYQTSRKDTLSNPQVIFEVLSKSTEDYDWGDKFRYYRTLPTLQDYVLVDQYETYVGQFYKTASQQWVLTVLDEESAVLRLHSLEFAIPLTDIYDKVDFEVPTIPLQDEDIETKMRD